jgi:hypothetical protein
MFAALFASVLSESSFATRLSSTLQRIRDNENNLTASINSKIAADQGRLNKRAAIPQNRTTTTIFTTNTIVPAPIDDLYTEAESSLIATFANRKWTKPSILRPFWRKQLLIEPVNGRWTSAGPSCVFVFQLPKGIRPGRVWFPAFEGEPCSPHDVRIDGFNGSTWSKIRYWTLPNGTNQDEEYKLEGVKEVLKGFRIIVKDNYGDPSWTCLSEVRISGEYGSKD